MNTNTLTTSNESFVKPKTVNWLAQCINKIVGWFKSTEIQKAQEYYNFKRNREMQQQTSHDRVRGLPLEQKLQFGCYQWMD